MNNPANEDYVGDTLVPNSSAGGGRQTPGTEASIVYSRHHSGSQP